MDFAKTRKKKIKKQKVLFLKILTLFLFIIILVFSAFLFYLVRDSETERFTIALISRSILLVSFNKEDKNIVVVRIPENVTLNIASGKGELEAGGLLRFDQIQKKKGALLLLTLREFLGVPVDGWIEINKNSNIVDTADFLKLRGEEFNLLNVNNFLRKINNSRTNLTLFRLAKFYFDLGKVRSDKIEIIDLEKSAIFTKEDLPDGSSTYKVDSRDLDALLKDKLLEKIILREKLAVSVLNGAKSEGLATKASRIVSNMGANVVVVSKSDERTVDCLIYVLPQNLKKYTVKRLSKVFSCEVKKKKDLENERSQITLIVGSNYEKEILGL